MDVKHLLDPNPALRTADEWQHVLGDLVESLCAFTGIAFEPTSWLVEDDRPGYACASKCVNVRGTVSAALGLDACGGVCVTINFGEAAWVSCDLLLFAAGQRVRGQEGLDLVFLSYGDAGWENRGWVADDYGEWESHTTDDWWRSE